MNGKKSYYNNYVKEFKMVPTNFSMINDGYILT